MSSAPPLSPVDVRRGFAWAIFLVALALVPVVLWPGDVSFLIDEPRLLAMAWHANHDGVLATSGLAGNFGVRYGPLAVQVYQALLLITHDPYLLVILRGLLCGGATAAGLLWLARTLRLPAWFAAAVLVAPLVVTYQRVLWDASFAIPIGTLAVAALADFVATGRRWSLRGCVAATVLVPLIHPQGLPLFLPIAGWLAWRKRDALWRDRMALFALGALLVATHGVYFVLAAGDVWWRVWHGAATTYPGAGSRGLSALAPFLGGNLLAGIAAVPPELPKPVLVAALWASRAIYPLSWLGIALALRRTFGAARAGQGSTPRETVMAIVLAGLALQALLFGVLRIPCGPQYFFGTFPFHVLAAWLAIEALNRWRIGIVSGALYAVGGGVLTLGTALAIHRHGYGDLGWPTLRESVEVSRALNFYSDTTVRTDVDFYAKHPEPLRALRLLLPTTSDAPRASGRLMIRRLASPGVITIIDTPPEVEDTPGSLIDITPLPRGWIPPRDTW
jgi:hypothetical protein